MLPLLADLVSFDDLVLVLFVCDVRALACVIRGLIVGRQAAITEQQDSTVDHTPRPTPVQLGSVKVQSVLKIACMRTAEVAQTLGSTSQSMFPPKMEQLKRLRETYKAPSRKIPVKDTLIFLVTCSFHIIGSGKTRNKMSRIIFAIPVPSAEALIS